MTDRQIIEWNINLKDSRLTKDEKRIYNFIEDYHDAFGL